MAKVAIYKDVIENLYSIYKTNGYITESILLDVISDFDMPLDAVDYICDSLLSKGVIIQETFNQNFYDEDYYDRSRTSYNKIFKEIERIDQSTDLFLKYVRNIKPPFYREWQHLIPQAKNGNIYAKNRIIEMYLRIAAKTALMYHNKYKIPLAEAIQDACVGLIIALDKYDTSRNESFITYATWWIRNNILREAPPVNPLVYMPIHVKEKIFLIIELLEQYQENISENGKVYSYFLEVIADSLACSLKKVSTYISYINKFESLEELLAKDECLFSDKCYNSMEIIDNIYHKQISNIILNVLESLSPRARKIILLRFGFFDGKEWTLEEIGSIFNISRERVRQIEKKTIEKIKKKKEILSIWL